MKHPKNSVSGVALVIVLGFLVIISALAVAFFSSINTEMKASRNFAAGITTRQLADSAVQIVMGQISSAATRGIDTNGVGHEVWASQPGMIRVFGVNAGGTYTESANADAFFKLYSSDQMIVSTQSGSTGVTLASFNPSQDYLNTWDQSPAIWTDLNAPVIVRDPNNGNTPTPRFPIIDPRAYAFTYTPDPTNPDPWANDIEGFTYDSSGGIDGIVGPKNVVGGDNSQRLPMPVKWIYVLQDGTLTTPNSVGTTTADFSGAAPNKQPSAQNPIVGRVAFWTDDETSKLNLNTAAGYSDRNVSQLSQAYQQQLSSYAGSYWDTPRFYTQFDYGIPQLVNGQSNGVPDPSKASGGLALCQLLQFEFQRYPGHPATTSLAPVLDTLLTSEQIYDVVPRYSSRNLQGNQGSTQGGTVRVIVDPYSGIGANPPGNTPPNPNAQNTLELQPKQDRLYANADEFLFGAHSTSGVQSTSSNWARSTNNQYAKISQTPYAPISPQVIDRLRFFMTAQGRSPELNVFGQPRISCWPVRSETAQEATGLNVFDNLMVFCSTVGAANSTGARPDTKTDQTSNGIYRYIFTRREITNSSMLSAVTRTDIYGNHTRYEFTSGYVPNWQLPGVGQPSRNSELLQNYLYGTATQPGLTSRALPGNGYKFSGKYSDPDRQGVLTEIFDYILLANSQDTTTSITGGQTIKFAPLGYVPPSQPSFFTSSGVKAKGFGRMSTICEATLDFYYAGPQMDAIDTSTDTSNIWIPKGSLGNSGWSKWDPLNPNKRYALVGKDPTDLAHYGRVLGGYMRAFVLFSMFDPMQGYAPKAAPADSDPKLTIEALWQTDFAVGVNPAAPASYTPLGFPVGSPVSTAVHVAPGSVWGGRNYGGYEGFAHTLQGAGTTVRPYKIQWSPGVPLGTASPALGGDYGETYMTSANTGTYTDKNFAGASLTNNTFQEYYPFQSLISKAVLVNNDIKTFNFLGGNVTVNLYYGGSSANSNSPALQTFKLAFPSSTAPWPVPQGAPQGQLHAEVKDATPKPVQIAPTPDVSTWLAMPATDLANFGPTPVGVNPGGPGMRSFYWTGNGCFFANMAVGVRVGMSSAYRGGANFETSLQASWSFATRNAWVSVGNGDSYNPHTNGSGSPIDPGWYGDRWRNIVQPGDTIRSLLYWDGNSNSGSKMSGALPTTGGDLRIAALSPSVPAAEFQPHPDYYKGYSRACVLRGGDGTPYFPVGVVTPLVGGATNTGGAPAYVYAVPTDSTKEAVLGNHISLGNTGTLKMQPTRAFGNLPWGGGNTLSSTAGVNGVMRREADGVTGKNWGDFDTGLGDFPDGPFCNKQDEGNVIYRYWDSNLQQYIYPIPYFTQTQSYQPPGNVFTSPSRQMPSPAMFGSLPSLPANGGKGGLGWTTLAFSPNTAGPGHPGNATEPKDHNLLDFFQMPVVEPYPISEPFSTAGKVNLNYRIAPFDYIRRSTALRGALYPLRITAVQSQWQSGGSNANYLTYKTGFPSGTPLTTNFRLRLDRDKTVQSFDGFFDSAVGDPNNGFFKVASQVCERWLYPKDGANVPNYAGTPAGENTQMQLWWANYGDLTGDNEREKPYVDLYPRVCTKSNTFTVHMKVQTLRQTPGHPTTWIEGKDAILGEYRGSSTIERYIDPADPRFNPTNSPTYNPDKQSVEPLYRFRIVVNKKFTP